jgi:hypothetical protein
VDFVYLGLILVLTAATAGYLWLCDILEGRR